LADVQVASYLWPVYKVPEEDLRVLSRYEDIVWALRDSRVVTFSAELDPPVPFISHLDPPQHTWLRRKVSSKLTHESVRRWAGLVRDTAEDALNGLGGAPVIDFISAFAWPVADRVMSRILGADDDGRDDDFKFWSIGETRYGYLGERLTDYEGGARGLEPTPDTLALAAINAVNNARLRPATPRGFSICRTRLERCSQVGSETS
jgi:cytochrome P450